MRSGQGAGGSPEGVAGTTTGCKEERTNPSPSAKDPHKVTAGSLHALVLESRALDGKT